MLELLTKRSQVQIMRFPGVTQQNGKEVPDIGRGYPQVWLGLKMWAGILHRAVVSDCAGIQVENDIQCAGNKQKTYAVIVTFVHP